MVEYKEIEPEESTFKSLVVDLTHRCNMRCANCYIPNRNIPDMDKYKLFEFIKRLPKKTFIRLIGAEATMREDLPEIIKFVKAHGHHPSLTTNGLKLADYNYVKLLMGSGLRMFCLSMNGADEDSVYKKIDNGRYAEKKVQALNNLFACKAFIDVGCIIAKDINENTVSRLVNLIVRIAKENGRKFYGGLVPTIRFKSIGHIGRYMSGHSYRMSDLVQVISSQLGIRKDEVFSNPCVSGSNLTILKREKTDFNFFLDKRDTSFAVRYPTELGPMYIRIIDWEVDSNGVPDAGNLNRGRITQNWKVAPFFEHLKSNEFGY